jgi:calcineurin-like phosphoesterase family protein
VSGAIWFVGDLHFGHEKVSGLRGFGNTEAHDDSIARQWHKQVKDGDLVYVLGDISGGSRTGEAYALTVIQGLPGRKRLIAGNHDSVASIHRTLSPHLDWYNSVFERVSDYGRVKLNRQDVLLSHYPYRGDHTDEPRYAQYRLPDIGAPLIHAHTHSSERENGRELCVSWEAWKRLVNLGDVVHWLDRIALSASSEQPELP